MFRGLADRETVRFFFFFFFPSIESWPVDPQATMLEFPVNGSATVSSYIFFPLYLSNVFRADSFQPLSFLFIFRVNFFVLYTLFNSIYIQGILKIVQRVVSLITREIFEIILYGK